MIRIKDDYSFHRRFTSCSVLKACILAKWSISEYGLLQFRSTIVLLVNGSKINTEV